MTATLPDPASIDTSFVPRFRDDVVKVPVKDESVLYEEDTGQLHQLDPIATIVCDLFDGATTIGEAVDELADAFGADRTVIETDVLAMATALGRKGLFPDIQGEAPPEEDEVGC